MDLSTTILVLKKTKLGETDLIITGFSEEGVHVRAVAKGARKPGSRLGTRLELFSVARVLIHEGRNLGIIREAETVAGNEGCRSDVIHSAGAAVIVELLDRVSADGDREERLFLLAREALRCLGEVPEEGVVLIAAAAAMKIASQLGFKPSLKHCVCCGGEVQIEANGEAIEADRQSRQQTMPFSFDQGGVICPDCLPEFVEEGHTTINAQVLEWVDVLITGRFIDITPFANAEHRALGELILGFAGEWISYHLVRRLKSLDFLLGFG